jgi:aryl-alcohol dehydrogenase-like predicted oxidoreductase
LDGVSARGQGARAGREQLQRRADGGVRAAAPLASNQPPYNLFERQIDGACGENLPWCAANGVAVLTWSTLCRSLLAGRVTRGMKFDAGTFAAADPKFQEPRFSQYMTAVERLTAFARERYGKTLLELAVRWVLDRPGVSVALWGAKRPDQLDAVAGVWAGSWTPPPWPRSTAS